MKSVPIGSAFFSIILVNHVSKKLKTWGHWLSLFKYQTSQVAVPRNLSDIRLSDLWVCRLLSIFICSSVWSVDLLTEQACFPEKKTGLQIALHCD